MKKIYLEILNDKFEDVSKKIDDIEGLILKHEEFFGDVNHHYEDTKVILEEIQYHLQLKIEKETS